MKKTLHLIFADLLNQKRFTLLFILNLSLGLTGFVALDSFRNHLEGSLALRSRSILGADLGMSSRHPLTQAQKKVAQVVFGNVPSSDMIETYSMVANLREDSRLIQIKAIDQQFPFYGVIKLKNQGPQDPSKAYDILSSNKAWVYPEVLLQLGLEIGDDIVIGTQRFQISDVVVDDSASGFSTSMAPRIYIDLNQLNITGLISSESLAWYTTVYKKKLLDNDYPKLIDTLFTKKEIDSSVKVFSHSNVSGQMGRMLGYLTDYLGLVSVAAIFLASIGATFLFRSYVNSKVKEMAIFRSLGMSSYKALSLILWQILFLGSAASLLCFIFSLILTPFLTKLLADLVSVPIILSLRWQGMAVASFLGIFGSLLICLPMLLQMKNVRPAILFRSTQVRLQQNSAGRFIHIIALFFLWGLAVWQANSWFVGSTFILIFVISGIILGGFFYLALWLVDRFATNLGSIGTGVEKKS